MMLGGLEIGLAQQNLPSLQSIISQIQQIIQGRPSTRIPIVLPSPTSTEALQVPEIDLREGMKGLHVRQLQEILKDLGYLPAEATTTGYLDSQTREAIRKLQMDNHLPQTGFFGPMTRALLKAKLKERGLEVDRNVDINCMKPLVEKRENALLSAWESYAGEIKTARETRKSELLNAWSIEDPFLRHSAIKSAWNKWRLSVITAKNHWITERIKIWSNFRAEAQNCQATSIEGPSLEEVPTTPEGMD